MDQLSLLEAVLFLSTKPLSWRQVASACLVSQDEARALVKRLAEVKNVLSSGIHVVVSDDAVQLVTNPALAESLAKLADEDAEPELTRPSLETLTIVAYRGPITKPEIEAIRGVNCTLILRNLLMRGLVEERDDAMKMQPVYVLSMDALRYFGLHDPSELPDYAELHGNAQIDKLLAALSLETPGV
ncbi:MAG: Segregation and condensation protein B [Candidatus Uhrbacteria bacterium GW2011_GWD2_52_7]|uniref:Segregation and condensation protein B n=1 Tax=Candidatus Uhrbacteria bacterium GW2011_GWD2_52_7 TaxID=1618989 RepID=A0A0G1XEW0_9BACT|nr:MAG: Segregation and condensation protein B [Candidatus Uhrbacteria bacterium GW2011_GWD2_52_7]